MNFRLVSPCSSCPFRRDVPGFLHPDRAREIIAALCKQDATFGCHKTIDYDATDDGEDWSGDPQADDHCAGALILQERSGHANQLTRIAERLGLYDRRKLRMDAPVFDTPAEFIAHHRAAERARR